MAGMIGWQPFWSIRGGVSTEGRLLRISLLLKCDGALPHAPPLATPAGPTGGPSMGLLATHPNGWDSGTQRLAWFLRCTLLWHLRGSSSSKPRSAIWPDLLYVCVVGS